MNKESHEIAVGVTTLSLSHQSYLYLFRYYIMNYNVGIQIPKKIQISSSFKYVNMLNPMLAKYL